MLKPDTTHSLDKRMMLKSLIVRNDVIITPEGTSI